MAQNVPAQDTVTGMAQSVPAQDSVTFSHCPSTTRVLQERSPARAKGEQTAAPKDAIPDGMLLLKMPCPSEQDKSPGQPQPWSQGLPLQAANPQKQKGLLR